MCVKKRRPHSPMRSCEPKLCLHACMVGCLVLACLLLVVQRSLSLRFSHSLDRSASSKPLMPNPLAFMAIEAAIESEERSLDLQASCVLCKCAVRSSNFVAIRSLLFLSASALIGKRAAEPLHCELRIAVSHKPQLDLSDQH